MTRTLDNCKVIHYYGKPTQNNGICDGVMLDGILHEKCQHCYLRDIKNATKVCIVCGKEFISTNPKATMCSDECREKRKNSLKAGRKHNKKKKTLDETLKELDEYNRTHDTYLTYGKYKNMLFIEEMKRNRERGVANEQRSNFTNKIKNNVR
jgi:predicted nucleic acid-binding Zn ribbon protein